MNRARKWVYDLADISATQQAVLLAMVEFTDRDGICWPSVQEIADMARMTCRAVQIATKALVGKGLVVVLANGGGTVSNRYQVKIGSGKRRERKATVRAVREVSGHIAPAPNSPPTSEQGSPLNDMRGEPDSPLNEVRGERRSYELEEEVSKYITPPTPPCPAEQRADPPVIPRPRTPPPIPSGPVGDLLHGLNPAPAKLPKPALVPAAAPAASSKAKRPRPQRPAPKPKRQPASPPEPVPAKVQGRDIWQLSTDLADAYERISGIGLCFEGMWPGFRAMTAELIAEGVNPDRHMLEAVEAAARSKFQPYSLGYWRSEFRKRRDVDMARKAREAA